MTEPERGILAEVREAGRKEGRAEIGEYHSILSEAERDELIAKGGIQAESNAPSRLVWWLLGVLSGTLAVWLGWCFGRGF